MILDSLAYEPSIVRFVSAPEDTKGGMFKSLRFFKNVHVNPVKVSEPCQYPDTRVHSLE